MNLVKGLATLIWGTKLYLPELIHSIEGHPKLSLLYQGLVNDKFKDDDDASMALYQSDKRHSAYLKLKNNLRRRLIDAVFFIDTQKEKFSDRQRAYFECYKEWAAAKIILSRNTQPAAMVLLEKILKKAEVFEFTDLVVDITRSLRLHYGTREGRQDKFIHYNEEYHKYWEILRFEDLAEEYYVELSSSYVQNKALKSETQESAIKAYEELKPAVIKYGTYRLLLYSGLIQLIVHSSVNDYERLLEVCDYKLEKFSQKPYTAGIPIQIFTYQQLVCFIQLGDYSRGQQAAPKALQYIEKGSYNWFKYNELFLQFSFHTENFQEGCEVLERVFNEKAFELLPASLKEIWYINLAFAVFLQREGKISLPPDDSVFNHFRLGKFLNTIPIFSKDKRGMNVPILIVQMLLLLQEQKDDQVIDRIDAMKKYCSRYLKENELFRSNCFINMLLEIPLQNFHPVAIRRHTEKYWQRLKKVPLETAQQTREIEIIPYEKLWAIILEHLENRDLR